MDTVERYYDEQCESEWQRMERHKLEFAITKKALDEQISEGDRVLDVGGGPGRYSIYLADRGCEVTLLDLSAQNVQRARQEAANAGVKLAGAVHGNALELDSRFTPGSFDAVLCMGPMYHLHAAEDRRRVLSQCLSMLRQGGVLVVAFISAYAVILDSLKRCPETILSSGQRCLDYLQDGRNYAADGFTDAYFTRPDEVEQLFEGFPIKKKRLLAAEGLGSLVEPTLNTLPEEQFNGWVELFWHIADHPSILGACEHLLYVGEKVC